LAGGADRTGRAIRFRGQVRSDGGVAARGGVPYLGRQCNRGPGRASGRGGGNGWPGGPRAWGARRDQDGFAGGLERAHMNLAELFIRRPVMTTLVMVAILLFGLAGYRLLPVSDLPNVDFPTINVTASLPGASPDTMASSVATPLEKQFTTIAGLDSMTSTSALGITNITLKFSLSRNIDSAGQDVQAAIARAAGQLPPNLPTPPTFNKVNPADQPIL